MNEHICMYDIHVNISNISIDLSCFSHFLKPFLVCCLTVFEHFYERKTVPLSYGSVCTVSAQSIKWMKIDCLIVV